MKGPIAAGISLWLVPPSAELERLGALIQRLSRRHGTPPFEPHVTLLGGLGQPVDAVLPKVAELARALGPIPIRLTVADQRDEYFRCVFLRAEQTPELLDAHARARDALGRRDGPPFVPHLSLVYGDLPADRRASAAAEIGEEYAAAFLASELQTVRTEGDPREWRRLAAFPLSTR